MIWLLLLTDWLKGGILYNFVSLVLSLGGGALGILGLVFAFWQVRQAKDAADSAREAVEALDKRLGALASVTRVAKIQANWEQLRHFLNQDFLAASLRCTDVREELAVVRFQEETAKLLTENKWQSLLTDVAVVQRLLDVRTKAKPTAKEVSDVTKLAGEISDRIGALNGAAHAAARSTSINHANT